jgi:PHD/YefM family antitoxin component YafN of YafNO toxin-antitoxin module
METVTIPMDLFEQMKAEIKVLRNTKLYKRLLECKKNIAKDKEYTRKDLGF